MFDKTQKWHIKTYLEQYHQLTIRARVAQQDRARGHAREWSISPNVKWQIENDHFARSAAHIQHTVHTVSVYTEHLHCKCTLSRSITYFNFLNTGFSATRTCVRKSHSDLARVRDLVVLVLTTVSVMFLCLPFGDTFLLELSVNLSMSFAFWFLSCALCIPVT